MGGWGQLLLGCRLAQEVPLAGIALSYKKNLYRKVNSSKSALAANVIILIVPTTTYLLARLYWPGTDRGCGGGESAQAGHPDLLVAC